MVHNPIKNQLINLNMKNKQFNKLVQQWIIYLFIFRDTKIADALVRILTINY